MNVIKEIRIQLFKIKREVRSVGFSTLYLQQINNNFQSVLPSPQSSDLYLGSTTTSYPFPVDIILKLLGSLTLTHKSIVGHTSASSANS